MARQLLFTFLIFFSVGAFGQENQAESNKTNFNTVFKNIKSGEFDGTANGVLFIKNSEGQDLVLDFQGSQSKLTLEQDKDEVYDVSTKIYNAKTTSGKSKIEYHTYNYANKIIIQLSNDTFQVGIIDGASDEEISGLKYYYKSEKGTEYLVLQVEKELILTNYHTLLKNINYDETNAQNLKQNKRVIKLLPNSTLVFAIKRDK